MFGSIKVADRGPPKVIILDMDSRVSPTHGDQEGAACNGRFGRTCHQPLFLFNHVGDPELSRVTPWEPPFGRPWATHE